VGLLGKTANAGAFSFLSERRFRQSKNNKASHFEGSLIWMSGNTETASLHENPDSNAFELVKYIPQSYLETLCNELGLVDEGGFDDELRSVIFSHVPDEERLGQNSLEDLIAYKTAQATAKIEILQKELGRITSKIVELEVQGSTEHRTKIEGALVAKQQELEAHDKSIPVAVPPPQGSDEQKEKLDALSKQLGEKKAEIESAEGALSGARKELAKVNLLLSAAQRLVSKIDNFERQVVTFRLEAADEIEALGLKEADVFTVKLTKDPVINKRSEFLADQSRLERELKVEEKGSKAENYSRLEAELKVLS
jgi:hypothetical protein